MDSIPMMCPPVLHINTKPLLTPLCNRKIHLLVLVSNIQ